MKKTHFLISYVSLLIIMTGYSIVVAYIPVFSEKFGVNVVAVSLVISLYALGQFIFSPIMGDLIEKTSQKNVLTVGLFCYAILNFFIFTASSFIFVLILRFLAGIAASAIFPAAESYVMITISKYDKLQVTRYSMLLSTANGIGMAMGPFIGIVLLSYHLEVPYSILLFFITIFIALCSYFFLGEISLRKKNTNFKASTYFKELAIELFEMSKARKERFILFGFLIFGIISSALEANGLKYLLVTYNLKDNFPYAVIIVMVLICVICFLKIGPIIEKKFDYVTILTSYAIISTGCFICLLFIKNLNLFIIFLSLSFLSLAIFSSVMVSFISNETKAPARILATKNSLICLGMTVGPIIGGFFFTIEPKLLFLPLIFGLILISIFGIFTKLAESNKK
ncbi:MAG: MFS transporter [Mycoplasmatales bacterium]